MTSFGYEGETILLARITPPADLAEGKPVTLDADVSYLVCEKICIPGEASLSLPLAVSNAPSQRNPIFENARARLPQASPWSAQLRCRCQNG